MGGQIGDFRKSQESKPQFPRSDGTPDILTVSSLEEVWVHCVASLCATVTGSVQFLSTALKPFDYLSSLWVSWLFGLHDSSNVCAEWSKIKVTAAESGTVYICMVINSVFIVFRCIVALVIK